MKTIEKIAESFVTLATEHGEAYESADYKKANKLHKKLHDLYDTGKSEGIGDVFSQYLNNNNESVRLWAAIFTLRYNPEDAEKTLNSLAQNSTIKMTAQTTLNLWKSGKLDKI